MNVLKIERKHLVMKHRAWRTSQSQHMKRTAILLCFSLFPREESILSQDGARPSGNEVISRDASARSASAACNDAEKVATRSVCTKKTKRNSKVLRTR
eukprot:2425946-Alexandrium_andersonii.AAC.1